MDIRVERNDRVLNRAQAMRALAIIREERRANPVLPSQRRLFRWFQFSFWGFWLSVVIAYGIAFVATEASEGIFVTIITAPMVCFISLLASLKWNWRLLRDTWGQFRIARRAKLWWVVERHRWFSRVLFWVAALISAPMLLAVVFNEFWLFTLPVMLLVAPVYLFLHVANRRLDLIAGAAELEQLVADEHAAGALDTGFIRVSADAFERMAEIEDAQIQRRRAEAIDAFRSENEGFALLKSRAMVHATTQLDAATHLRVEERVAELGSDPHPPDAAHESGGPWHVRVLNTPMEILYRVDEEARRVDLLTVQSVGQEVPPVNEAEVPDA